MWVGVLGRCGQAYVHSRDCVMGVNLVEACVLEWYVDVNV